MAKAVFQAVEHTSDPIRLSLLGSFQLVLGDGIATKLPKKAQALLAFLAMHRGKTFARDELATLLWGDSATEQARQSLRQCLSSLRVGTGESRLLAASFDSLALPVSSIAELDIDTFAKLSRSERLEDLQRASELFRGEFLAGLNLPVQSFNDWLTIERQKLSSQHFQLLERLAASQFLHGDLPAAIETARQLTALDPLREEGHRLLMRLLAESGDRASALKQYARCIEILRDDLGLKPSAATSELAEAIRTGREAGDEPGQTHAAVSVDTSLVDAATSRGAESTSVFAAPGNAAFEKPSIVVLPFANLSGDPGQAYLADGITEDVTIALGREKWLFVIASASAFALRERTVNPLNVGSELGVRYVLRGSVRRNDDWVRIVVQLTDAAVGGHLWSERFEDKLDNVFSMQDRLTNQVAAMIAPALRSVEIERAAHKPTESLTAYELYLRALPLCRRSAEDNGKALRLLRQATDLDANYGAAYALAARCYHFRRMMGWAYPDDLSLMEGVRQAHLAIRHGASDSEALWMAGLAIAIIAGELVEGLRWIERSLLLNPNSANAWIASCFTRTYLDDTDTALEHFDRAQQLNPLDSTQHLQWHAAATAHFVAGRYEEADLASDRTLNEIPDYPGALRLKIATCGLLGKDAGPFAMQLLRVNPDASVAMMRAYWKDLMSGIPEVEEAFLEGFRRAGMPETPSRKARAQS